MKWMWLVAGLAGAGGGYCLGRLRSPQRALSIAAGTTTDPRGSDQSGGDSRLLDGPAPVEQADSVGIVESVGSEACRAARPADSNIIASYPYWGFPAPSCQLHGRLGDSRGEQATAVVDDGPRSPICTPALHDDYFLVRASDERLQRIPRALNPFGFAYYRGQNPHSMGDSSMINGVPMRVAQMHVSDPPDAVLTHYAHQLALNDIYPVPQLLRGKSGPLSLTFHLGANDENVLILVPTNDGTIVLAAVGSKLKKFPTQAQLPPSFPHPADVDGVSVDSISDRKSLQRDISFTAALSPSKLRSFYQEALANEGFQPEPVTVEKPGLWQQGFFREDEVMNVSAHLEPSGRSVVDVIWVTHAITGDTP